MDIELRNTIKCDQGTVRAVRYNVDGAYCLTCGADKKIKLWNPYKSLELKTYGGHADEVLDVCGSCDSSFLLSCGADKTAILWDVSSGQIVRRFRGHAGKVNCVKFNEESSVGVSGSSDNSVACWDIRSRRNDPIQALKEARDCITSLQVTDHEILVSSLDCCIRQYDIRNGKVTRDYIGEPVISTSFTQDGQCIVVGSRNLIRLMDKETGELLSEYRGHSTKDYVIDIAVDAKDQYILSGSTNGKVFAWELISNRECKVYPHQHNKPVHSLTTHPTSNYFMSASGDNIYLWGPELEIENETD